MAASLPHRVQIKDDLLAAELAAGEVALLSIPKGAYFALNPVAAWLWQTWIINDSVPDSIDSMVQRYKVDRSVAESDVAELISELTRLDLIAIDNIG